MPFLPFKFCNKDRKKNTSYTHSNNPSSRSNKRKGRTLARTPGSASMAFSLFCFPDTTYSLHFLFFLLAINLVFSLHGTAVPAATHRWERGKSVVFFLWSSMGCFCRYPKKFQSHSSLKSYTEYWLPPGWLPRRDVEFAGDCRRALLVGGCEDAEDDDEEDDAAGGG